MVAESPSPTHSQAKRWANITVSNGDSFSKVHKLRDLFSVQLHTSCHTHELLGCNCLNEGGGLEDKDNGSTNDDSNDANEDEVDEDEDGQPAGFQSASSIKPETITKMDKAVSVDYKLLPCAEN